MTSIIDDLTHLESLIDKTDLSITETEDASETVIDELRNIAKELS